MSEPASRQPSDRPLPLQEARAVAAGERWSISEHLCRAGPRDRAFEERHGEFAVAAVVSGSFGYRSDHGRALLLPGAFLLGNPGGCYECGHDHGAGDRCVAFHFDRSLFEEVASAVTGSGRFRFSGGALPVSPRTTHAVVEVEAFARGERRLSGEELALWIAGAVVGAASGAPARGAGPTASEERRITRAIRHIEAHATERLDLAALAGVAAMSRYHFLRTFRRVVGATPYRYLLDLRVRRAATRICTTDAPISAIAFEEGFDDLSTFNARFRRAFGMSPGLLRRRRGGGEIDEAVLARPRSAP